MKKTLISALALAAVGFFTAGCEHHGAYLPKDAIKYNQENTARFVDMDPATRNSVSCTGILKQTLPDGRLQVTANFINLENRRLEVQANCVFKDEQGFAVDETVFRPVILTENETRSETFKSMNDKAKEFTIRVRQAR